MFYFTFLLLMVFSFIAPIAVSFSYTHGGRYHTTQKKYRVTTTRHRSWLHKKGKRDDTVEEGKRTPLDEGKKKEDEEERRRGRCNNYSGMTTRKKVKRCRVVVFEPHGTLRRWCRLHD